MVKNDTVIAVSESESLDDDRMAHISSLCFECNLLTSECEPFDFLSNVSNLLTTVTALFFDCNIVRSVAQHGKAIRDYTIFITDFAGRKNFLMFVLY